VGRTLSTALAGQSIAGRGVLALGPVRLASLICTVAGFVVVVAAALILSRQRYDFTTGFDGENPGQERFARHSNWMLAATVVGATVQLLGTFLAYLDT
jgi:hypothetical protein